MNAPGLIGNHWHLAKHDEEDRTITQDLLCNIADGHF